MRFLLVEAGQSAVKYDAELQRAYKRLWVRKGNRAVAKVMVARRLAVRLYWMLRERVDVCGAGKTCGQARVILWEAVTGPRACVGSPPPGHEARRSK